jgi:hypothetical protein
VTVAPDEMRTLTFIVIRRLDIVFGVFEAMIATFLHRFEEANVQ